MADITIGNLSFSFEGNDTQLKAMLAKYEAPRTIKFGVQANGLTGTDAGMKELNATVKSLSGGMTTLTNAITAAGAAQARSFAPGRDTGLQAAARGVKILSDEYKQGGLTATDYAQRSTQLRTTLELLGQQAQPLSRQMATVQSALAQLAIAEGQAGKGSPIADRFRSEVAAAKQATESMNVYRMAWQRKAATDTETLNSMRQLEKGILAQKVAYEQEAAALQAKGVLDAAETRRLDELTTLQNRLGGSLRTLASVQAEVNGEFLKGSIGANIYRGTALAIKDTTAETERLLNAEKAGTITKNELKVGLEGQATAQRAALAGIEAEITATKALGVVQLQNVAHLAELRDAQNAQTRALAETVGAQERAAATQRAGIAGGLGIRGGGGLSNAAMGASFISPEIGGLAMAATLGPWVAGAAAVGLFSKAIGDGIDKAAVFQRGLTQVGAISGQTTAQMNDYGKSIQKLSTELPISTTKLIEMNREAVLVGLHGQEGMSVYMNTMAAFAVVTRDANGELGHTAEVGSEVVKILRSTGATTEEVTVGFGRMINGLIGLKTESGVAIPQVTALLKFWSSQGHAVGLTIEQMTGLSAALIQTGARAQGAGGALAVFYKKAEDAAVSGGPKLQAWANVIGLTAVKTKELLATDPMSFLIKTVEGTQRLQASGQALTTTLGDLGLKSQQVQRTMGELGPALHLVNGNIKIMTDSANDSGLAFRTAMAATNDYADKLTRIGHAWDTIKQNMGIAVLPGMTAVAAWALDFSKNLMNASDALNNILKATGLMEGKPPAPAGVMPYNKTTVNLDGLSPDQTKQANDLMAQITSIIAKQANTSDLASRLSGLPLVGDYFKALSQGGVDTTKGQLGALTQELHDLVATAKKAPFIGPLNNQQQYLAGTQPRGFTPDKAAIIARAAKELGVSPHDLAQVIAAETGGTFDPSTKNGAGSGATGLIQFMPTNARELGTTSAALANMSFEQQMEYVIKYFKARPDFHAGADLGTLYSAVSGSGYKRGTPGYDKNPNWDTNGNGVIDRGEAVNSPWFKSFDAPYYKTNSGTGGNTGAILPPSAAKYLAEAARIQNAIDNAQKEGGAAGFTAYNAATKELAAFTNGNKDAAAAVAYLSNQTKAAVKVQTEATKDTAQIQKALSQGNITDAQTALESLKVIQQKQLDNAGDSQAKRLAVVKQTSGQIYQAELDIAEATRKAVYANVADEKNPQVKAQQQASADKAYALAKQKAVLAENQALTAAQKSANTEADAAQKKQDQAVTDAAKARADTMKALREDDVKGAQANLAKLNEIRDRELAADKDNVVKKLATAKDYAAQTYALQLQINQAEYDKAVREANNGRVQERPKLLATAQTTLDAANLAARNKQTETVTQATDAQTSAVQKQRDAYSKLADSVRSAIQAGTFDEAQRQAALVSFNDLGRASEKLGLTHQKNVEGSRQTSYALIQEASGVDKATAAYEAYWKAQADHQDNNAKADAGMRGSYGVGQEGLQAALLGSGANRKLLGDPEAALTDLDQFSKEVADRIRRVYADELAQFHAYHDAVNAGITETTTAAYAQIKQGMADDQAAADEASTTVDSLTTMLQGVLGNGLDPLTSGYVQLLDEIIAKGGEAGAAAQQVKENLAQLLFLNGGTDTASVAQRTALNATLQAAKNGAFPDGGHGTNRTTNNDHVDTQFDNLPNVDGLASARTSMDSTRLEAQHSQGLISEQVYLDQKRKLDEVAALNAFLIADRDQSKHAANLAAYQAQMLGIDQKYNTDKKVIDDKATTDALAAQKANEAFLIASRGREIALARTHLDNLHTAQLVSDRDFQTLRESQDADAAKASYDAGTTDWFQYQEELTRITRQGVADRAALDKAGFDQFVSGIDSLGSALGGLQTVAGTALTAVGGALKLGQQFKDLQKQNATAFGSGGTFFDKLGAIGSDLGFVGSAIGLVGQLGDAILNLSPAYQAAKKAALDLAAAETQAMGAKNFGGKSILNPYYDALQNDAAALTKKANAGFFEQIGFLIFGAPKTLDKAASETLQLASQTFNDFAGGLYSSLESALMNAFDSGNFDGVAAAVEKSLNDLVAKMYLQTLIAKSKIGDDLKMLADDQAAGKSITGDLTRLKGDTSSVISQFQAGSAGLTGFGAGVASATNSSGPSSVIGAGPSALYGVPEIKLPDSLLASFNGFSTVVPVFAAGAADLRLAVSEWRSFMAAGPVSRSGNGGLV